MKSILDQPTVGELIDFLKQHAQPDWPIRIEDADTNWEISKIHFCFENGKLWMTGDYTEMGPGEGPGA